MLSRIVGKLSGRPNIEKLVQNGLKLGENVHIGPHTIIDDSHCWLISIGDDCIFAPRVHILAHDASTKNHIGYTKIGLVEIGKRTFIGAGSIVLPGVKIGEDVIIGAGSVVTRDVPAGSVATGNPAVVVGSTKDYAARHKEKLSKRPVYDYKGWSIAGDLTEEKKKIMRESLKDGIGYIE